MTDAKKTCWICAEPGFGETYLGNTHICYACQDKIRPQRVKVAGKQLAEGVAAMARDRENNLKSGFADRERT